jgi:hypothetical protein
MHSSRDRRLISVRIMITWLKTMMMVYTQKTLELAVADYGQIEPGIRGEHERPSS